MKIYRGADGDLEPVEMECEEFKYLNETTSGETMHSNTHFLTKKEAWESIEKSVDAGVCLTGREVLRCKKALRDAEKQAAQAVADYVSVKDRLRYEN